MNRYPRLLIDLNKLRNNASQINRICNNECIEVVGVTKGVCSLLPCVQQFIKGGCEIIASSRIEQIKHIREAYPEIKLMMIRIPMLSEVDDIVSLCDYSLNSNIEVLEALNAAAQQHNKVHKVLLMADIGDLREGWWDKDAMIRAAVKVDKEMGNLELVGTGTNLGCYGSLKASSSKLQELVDITESIEKAIGRKLQYISGGSTTSLPRVLDGDMPDRINMLRIGEGVLLSEYMLEFENYEMKYMHRDVFKLQVEIVEIEDKPTHPVGEIGLCDAFGHVMKYEDRGIRRRAILAIGKCDYGNFEDLIPVDRNIVVLGASSDHTIIDIEDAKASYSVGDILDFDLTYATLPYVTNSTNVKFEYIDN